MFTLERLRVFVGAGALLLWGVSILVDIFNPSYDPPQSLQLVILVVAGSLFAPSVVKKVNGDHHDEP